MTDSYRIRELEEADLPVAAQILAEGFSRHDLAFWQASLHRIGARARPAGTPAYGYGIEADGLQGIALAIGSLHGPAEDPQTIVNISSWTVRASQRGPAAKALYQHATSFAGMTFSNLSAAAHTLRTITGFGFTEGTAGQVVAIGVRGGRRRILSLDEAEKAGLSADRVEMMRYHATRGCTALCVDQGDRLAPMLFLPRRVKPGLPVAQLIYCEQMSDLIDDSRAIYLHLLRRGYLALLVDASGPVEGLAGPYHPGRAAKYYKGPAPRHAVDHSYSEMIYIGF